MGTIESYSQGNGTEQDPGPIACQVGEGRTSAPRSQTRYERCTQMSSFDSRPLSAQHPYGAALYRATLSLTDADILANRLIAVIDASALDLVTDRHFGWDREVTVRSLDHKFVTITLHGDTPRHVTSCDLAAAVPFTTHEPLLNDEQGVPAKRVDEVLAAEDRWESADVLTDDLAILLDSDATDLVKDRHVHDGDRELTLRTRAGLFYTLVFHVQRPQHVSDGDLAAADRLESEGQPYEARRRDGKPAPYGFQLSDSFSDFVDWVQTIASVSGTPVWGTSDEAMVMTLLADADAS